MHPSAYTFASTALGPEQVEGRRIVEAGAYDYNGSVRGAIEAMWPGSYLATDMQPGPGVDLVCPAEKLTYLLGEATADILISTEMLEHAEDWRGAVTGMVRVLAPGGLLLLTTRSAGFPYHPHPGDHWRYSLDDMDAIAEACGLTVIRLEDDPDAASPGVFLLASKPDGWDGAGMAEGLAVINPGPPPVKFATDKIHHGYLPAYLRIASELGPGARVCEVGVEHGHGLDLFQALYPDGLVCGVDADGGCRWPDGTVAVICDQDSPALPGRLLAVSSGWDLIVDDASHDGVKTAATFALLWPLVTAGGFYVIEDWMVALGWPGWDSSMLGTVAGLLPMLTRGSDVADITYSYGLAVARKKRR